jgi:YD repeat-containing protein
MRKWFLALALVVLPLVFSAAALAAPPTTEVTVVVNDETVDSDICDFDVTFVENGTFKTKTYYDGEGNIVKTILTNSNVRFTSTATANGKTLSTNYPLVFITYSDADIRVGLRNAYHVPGAGVVLLDAGRLILDIDTGGVIFEAGQHELLNGSVDAFCGYFES